MKKIYISILLAFFGVSIVFGQVKQNLTLEKIGEPAKAVSVLPNKGFSPNSAFLLMELEKFKKENRDVQKTDTSFIDKYNLFYIGDELFVNSFLIISDEFNKSQFESRGGHINSTSPNIITASIPVKYLNEIIDVEGVLFVQIAEKAKINMDMARDKTWVDWVHQGVQLPQAYFGDGVVVGIIDGGFDYTHTNFYDETGVNNYRIKRVWEQNATSGTPPEGYSYGRELKTQTSILNAKKDVTNLSHGTHVAGIAAGAGGGASNLYRGIASKSDLVLVSTTMTDDGIIDGIKYIFDYANSIDKPCVINISIGKHVGPHDGTSLFDMFCDDIVGEGKIIVGAAGNDGEAPLYVSKSYTYTDNQLYSFVKFPNSTIMTSGMTLIDIWGDPNQNYEVAVNIYNTNTNQYEDFTPYVQANSNNVYSYILYDYNNIPCEVDIATSLYPHNNKRNVQILIDNTLQYDNNRWVMIDIVATTGQTKMWAAVNGAQFTDNGYAYPTVSGSTNSTICEIGGTGNGIISVGAYTSKNSWTSFYSSYQTAPCYTPVGAIATFSSKGPTADGRTKPDITAPGNILASSVNSFDNNYTSASDWTVSGVTNGTDTWWFGMMAGTSMASPVVTGIIALWLEAYPHLTLTQAKQLLKDNAIIDGFTGTISSVGSNTWGWGKIDAHEGLKDLISKVPPQPTIFPNGNVSFCEGKNARLFAPGGYAAYLWSNNQTTQNITVTTGGSYFVRVTNNQGYISPWSLPKNVTVLPNPPTPTITLNGNVLSSSSSYGNQWYLNERPIAGATQQNYIVEQNGNYHVVVTRSNGCSARSNTYSITSCDIGDLERIGVTNIYPNPTTGLISIQFSDIQQEVLLGIYDASGRMYFQKRLTVVDENVIETINLENLTSGVYTLRILTKENQATRRIILMK